MATSIYLGNPPENIVKWIKEHHKPQVNYLCFTAEQANSTVKMYKYDSAPTVYLETSTSGEEGSWSDFTVCTYNENMWESNNDGTIITLPNVGDKVYFRAKQDNEKFATDDQTYNNFEMTGKISASGNLNTLLKADGSVLDLTGRDYCYSYIFGNCTSLTRAPELPATTLADGCYNGMFWNCYSLTRAPELPATTLASDCYFCMFYSCKSPFTFIDKTFDEVASLIQEQFLLGDGWYDENYNAINQIEIICSDKTMLATAKFNDEYGYNEFVGWTLTEK